MDSSLRVGDILSEAEQILCATLLGIVFAIAARSSDPAMHKAAQVAENAVRAADYKLELYEHLRG